MNPLKLLFLFISILLSFCSIHQTFALNYKNDFPSNFYTKSTVPDLNNPENYCTPWPGYDPKYLRLEYKFSGNYLDFDCYWDNGSEKLQAKGGWIMLKKEEPATTPPPPKIPGCTNPQALNYDPQATEENGTCIEKIEGCTDSTALNYNPLANVHKESLCEYTPPYTPQDISGAFEKSQVSIGATTWTMRVTLNMTGATLDPNIIQTWNHFKAVDSTTNDKTITLTLRQFDDQRLNVECTNYEVTIPRRALVTPQGDTNANPISGNFEVIGCPEKPIDENVKDDTINFPNAELNKNSQYLQIIGQKDGYYYVDVRSLSMLFFYILLSFSFFYAIYKFFSKKNF